MARPIKETPDLTGKDAKRFFDKMEKIKPISVKEMAQIKKSANKFEFIFD